MNVRLCAQLSCLYTGCDHTVSIHWLQSHCLYSLAVVTLSLYTACSHTVSIHCLQSHCLYTLVVVILSLYTGCSHTVSHRLWSHCLYTLAVVTLNLCKSHRTYRDQMAMKVFSHCFDNFENLIHQWRGTAKPLLERATRSLQLMNNFIFHLSKASPKLKLHGTYRARNVVKKRSQETREKAMYLSTGFMGCNFQAAVSLMNYLTDTANFKKVQDNCFELSETFTPNRSIFW